MKGAAGYDPQACGARCDKCPLATERNGGPVAPLFNKGAVATLIGQEPSDAEVKANRPFAGPSGRELDKALRLEGLDRGIFNLDNAIACKVPDKKGLAAYQAKRKAYNAAEGRRYKAAYAAQKEAVRGLPFWKKLTQAERHAAIVAVVGVPHFKNDPVDCCRPRVLNTIRRVEGRAGRQVFVAGAVAFKQLLPTEQRNFDQLYGGYIEGAIAEKDEEGEWLASGESLRWYIGLNPTSVLHKKHLRPLLRLEVGKAYRYFTDTLRAPTEAELWRRAKINPRVELLEATLFAPDVGSVRTFDWETTEADVLLVTPKAMNIGYKRAGTWHAFVIERVNVATGGYLSEPYWEACMAVLRRVFADANQTWVGQNSGLFDNPVARLHKPLGRKPRNHRDIMLRHRELYPQLRHNLALQVNHWTDWPPYKADVDGEGMAGTHDRIAFRLYCICDAIVTGELYDLYETGDPERDVQSVVVDVDYQTPMPVGTGQTREELDDWVQTFCTELHHIGVWLHEPTRLQMHREYAFKRWKLRKEGIWPRSEVFGMPKINASSIPQMQELLYKKLKVTPDDREMTENGAYGTGSATLRRVILEPEASLRELTPAQRETACDLLMAIYKERRVASKTLGTSIVPFMPGSKHLWDDGRVRSDWKMDTSVNRLRSRRPNFQNIPSDMKKMWQPEPGHIFVGCDMEQMHPRLAAVYWGISRLAAAFRDGEDCYSVIAHAIFGKAWEAVCPRDKAGRIDFRQKPQKSTHRAAVQLRQRAKTHFLATLYGASLQTRLTVLRKAEDENGKLAMKDLTIDSLKAADDAMFEAFHELKPAWQRTLDEAKMNGRLTGSLPWIREPMGGRQRSFYNGLEWTQPGNDISDCLNYPILAAESVIMHTLVQQVRKHWPAFCQGPGTGIFIQVHDQVGLELSIRGRSSCTKTHYKGGGVSGDVVPCTKAHASDPCDRGSASHYARMTAGELKEMMSTYSWQGVPFPAEESWGYDLSAA